jgi:cold-inducible RNA-binding protein
MEGTITFFDARKNFGFVQIEEAGLSYFLHGTSITGDLVTDGDLVAFEVEDDFMRPGEVKAVNVRKLATAPGVDPERLFFRNVPFSITQDELRQRFNECGPVESVQLICDRATGESRGYGFCRMGDARSALAAIAKLHGRELRGRRISVHFARQKPREVNR